MATLLVIEDNESNRVLLVRRLKPQGHEVLTAGDAEAGLALARTCQPQLILLDVWLPGMDGWQASRLLKSDPATRHIPIIIMTANAVPGDREKALDSLCDEFETKPLNFPVLFKKIALLLARDPAAPPAPPAA
ncbi:MAG: two-component system response regulator [Pedosphaera sp. Tous-C6FEB]|nr:MAG: two-component system response regulator [Pedosphaera sp. Tous-C6FEB]